MRILEIIKRLFSPIWGGGTIDQLARPDILKALNFSSDY